jgi:uncharacterized membrane protein YgaE (UPF0421/DUF939 family)
MLHQWDMCAFCIQDVHYPVSEEPEKRNAEVARFQRGVSRLPDDVQRYISEFVPDIFSFVHAFGKFKRNGEFFASLEKHIKLPKSTWVKAHNNLLLRRSYESRKKNMRRSQRRLQKHLQMRQQIQLKTN